MTQKLKGAYYTPTILTDFMIKHIAGHVKSEKVSILEPSVGDGAFISSLDMLITDNKSQQFNFIGIERDSTEIQKAVSKSIQVNSKFSFEFVTDDFLDANSSLPPIFDIAIGNPPYIKKTLLEASQINKCNQIHESAGLSRNAIRNIWPSFLIKATQLLNNDGILAMVLPSDLLQVSFSTELRVFLISNFKRLEIFTFDNLLFDCKGQDTILIFGYKQTKESGQYYANIKNLEQLSQGNFSLVKNATLSSTQTKWSHHYLSSDDLSFLDNLRKSMQPIEFFAETKPGIVTGANSFFIVDSETEQKYGLEQFTKPILQKGIFLGNQVEFSVDDYFTLLSTKKPCRLISLSDQTAKLSPAINEYLNIGVDAELPFKYKCSIRNKWYSVPNVSAPAQAFFLKRCHYYPKLILNTANVLVTDAGYMIKMKSEFDVNNLVFSFYNSLTFLFAELTGRYYGGGVLELTPNEFKQLPIPTYKCKPGEFSNFSKRFKTGSSHEPMLNDHEILIKDMNLCQEQFDRIVNIKKKLIAKRMSKEIIDFSLVV